MGSMRLRTFIRIFALMVLCWAGITGCVDCKEEKNGEKSFDIYYKKADAIAEEKESELPSLSECVNLVEGAIAYDKFFGFAGIHKTEGKVETNFYYDSENMRIFLVPTNGTVAYELSPYIRNYPKYSLSEVNVSYTYDMEWLGSAEVDYDIAARHSLPDITVEDKILLDKLCEYIYNELSSVQDRFSYDIYLGDFLRGYDEAEYATIDFVITGERQYYRYVEFKKEQDGYDIFLYPPLLNAPFNTELAEQNEFWDNDTAISNIIELNYLIGHLEK